MLENITERESKVGAPMTTINEPVSGADEYIEDLVDYFANNPHKGFYKA